MSPSGTWPWLALVALGAWHGLNPGMGWLFAAALGLQERTARGVWRALPPLAAGHLAAVGVAIAIVGLVGLAVPGRAVRWIVAALMLTLGVCRLFGHGHPRRGGLHVGAGRLAIWSFLVATAHGAGLMVLPFVLGPSAPARAHGGHAAFALRLFGSGAASRGSPDADLLVAGLPTIPLGLAAAIVHTAGYLLVTGLLAWLVCRRLGLRRLRRLWWNLDLVWALALIATALVTPWL